MNILNLIAGSVTPLGLLNDKDLKVTFCLDKDFLNDKGNIGVHPNRNTATISIEYNDLIKFIKSENHKIIEI